MSDEYPNYSRAGYYITSDGERVVTKESVVKYHVYFKGGSATARAMDRSPTREIKHQWYVYYDAAAVKHGKKKDVYARLKSLGRLQAVKKDKKSWFEEDRKSTFKYKWMHPGDHLVACREFQGSWGGSQYNSDTMYYRQEVLKYLAEGALRLALREEYYSKTLDDGSKVPDGGKLPDPLKTLERLRQYIKELEEWKGRMKAEKAPPMEPKTYGRHIDEMRGLKRYQRALNTLLAKYKGYGVETFHAAFIAEDAGTPVGLKVFLAIKDLKYDGLYGAYIVDWTNPFNEVKEKKNRLVAKSNKLRAVGKSETLAIQAVLDKWEKSNDYPPGRLRFLLPKHILERVENHSFLTGVKKPKSGFKKVAEFFGSISSELAPLLVIVTILMPFTPLATALLWTTLTSSTIEGLVNIGGRHLEGESKWHQDARDGLGILGNIFTGGGWKAGRMVKRTLGGRLVKWQFYGRVAEIGGKGTDFVDGILVTVDGHLEIKAIMDNPNLTYSERIAKAKEIMLKLGGKFAMAAVDLGLSAADKLRLAKRGKNKFHTMGDPGAPTLDLDLPLGVSGESRAGRMTGTAGDTPARSGQSAAGRRGKTTGQSDEMRPHHKGVTGPVRRLGLGKKSKSSPEINYIRWSKEKGFLTYGKLSGGGTFPKQIKQAMGAADEIHFNLDGVDVTRANGRINEHGELDWGNYTNHELWLLGTNKKFADKVTWWKNTNTEHPEGYWPPGLNDPR